MAAKKERIISAINARRRQDRKAARERREEAARIRREIAPPQPGGSQINEA